MKIAFLVWEYPPTVVGGLGTYAQYIAPQYVRLGHQVSVYTLNRGGQPLHETHEGVDVHRPMLANAGRIFPLFVDNSLQRWGPNLKFFSDLMVYNVLSAGQILAQAARAGKPPYDLVSFHDWLSGPAGMMLKDSAGLPCVFHTHSTEWGRTQGVGSEVVSRIEAASATAADQVITVSQVMKEDLVHHGWAEEKIAVVWNGVDATRYDPARYPATATQALRSTYRVAPKEAMLLFVGRLTAVKGIRYLIEALPAVRKAHPHTKLVVLGQGEQEQELVQLAAKLGVADAVRFRFEFVPEEERIAHYAAADVCVFPSTYEPFGIVSLEAMAMGKPVVVGANGVVGFKEQVLPNGAEQCGVHVDGSSPKDIAWGINATLQEPERARHWGAAGRQRVKAQFTWERVARETLGHYERTLGRAR